MTKFKQSIDIPATASSPKVLADLSDYTQKSIPWEDGTGEYLQVYYKEDEASQVVYLGSDENRSTAERLREVLFQTNNTESAQSIGTLTVTQLAGYRTYADPVITGISYEVIPASGGTVVPVVTYEQTWGYNGQESGGGVITSGAAISYSGSVVNESTGAVTADSKGIIESDQTVVDTVSVKIELNGKSVTSDPIEVYQEANKLESTDYRDSTVSCTYVQVAKTRAATNTVTINVSASGGTYQPTVSVSQVKVETYTSGSVKETNITEADSIAFSGSYGLVDINTGEVVINSLGTTLKSEETVEEVTVTAVINGIEVTCDDLFKFVQAENKVESSSYSDPQVSLSYSGTPVASSGGTVTPVLEVSQTETLIYTSGQTEENEITSGAEVTYSDTLGLVDPYTGEITFDPLDPGSETKTDIVTVTVTLNGKTSTDSFSVVQEGSSITLIEYGIPTVTISYDDIPASGGTVTPTITYEQVVTTHWSNGTTTTETINSGGEITYSGSIVDESTGSITLGTLGTTETGKSVVDTVTATVILNGQTGTSTSVEVYQEANVKTLVSSEYSDISVTLSYDITNISAAGGTATPALNYEIIRTDTYSYTSGATDTDTEKVTSGATVSYSGTHGVVDSSTGSVTASSKGTTISDVTEVEVVTASVTYNGVTSHSNSVTISQDANTSTVSYSTPTVNLSFNNTTIPAAGGTVQATVTYSQTVTTSYSSGSTASSTVSSGGTVSYSGTNGVVTSSGAVSANSRGTVYSTSTLTIDIVTATVTLNGMTGTSAAVTIYQAQNIITSSSYTNPTVTISYDDIPASGGTVTPTISYTQTVTETYSSGSTVTETINSGASISYSGSGVNTSTGAVSGDNLGTTVKSRTAITTATVTVTLNGKSTTEAVSVYQEANEVDTVITLNSLVLSCSDDNPIAYTIDATTLITTASVMMTSTYTSGSVVNEEESIDISELDLIYSISTISLGGTNPVVTKNADNSAALSWTPYPGDGYGAKYQFCTVKVEGTLEGVTLSDTLDLTILESLFLVDPTLLEFDFRNQSGNIEVTAEDGWTVEVED